jgi:hypothetical protein
MTYDPSTHLCILFGGLDEDDDYLSDAWAWDGSQWSKLYVSGPSQRWSSHIAYHDAIGKVLIFGGDKNFKRLGDTWTLNAGTPVGDLNCDCDVNSLDIDPFVLALLAPDQYAQQFPNCDRMLADANGDGSVNSLDIEPFVNLLIP